MARPDPHLPSDPAQDETRAGATTSRGPLIHVATRCTSIDEFVERFAAFASEGSLILPSTSELAIGTEGRFAILLRDRSVAMRGRCRVTDAQPGPVGSDSTVRRTMLRVVLLEMDEATQAIHRQLLSAQRPAAPLPASPMVSEPTVVSPPKTAAVPLPVSQMISERTEVSPPKEVQAPREIVPPPPLRPMPPSPLSKNLRAPTLIGVARPASGSVPPPPVSPKIAATMPAATMPAATIPTPTLQQQNIPIPTLSPPVAPPVARSTPPAPPVAPSKTRSVPPPPVTASPAPPVTAPPVGAAARVVTAPPVVAPPVAPPPMQRTVIGPPSAHAPAVPPTAGARPTQAPQPDPAAAARPRSPTRAQGVPKAPRTPTPPRVETRAPGASFTLPANPLSELGAADLESFIDCTLFESDSERVALDDDIDLQVGDDGGPTRELHPPPATDSVHEAPTAVARPPASTAPAVAARPKQPGVAGRSTAIPPLARRFGVPAALVVVGLVVGLVVLRKPTPPPTVAAEPPAAAQAPEPVVPAAAPPAAEAVVVPEVPAPTEAVAAKPAPPEEAVAAKAPAAPAKAVAAEAPAAEPAESEEVAPAPKVAARAQRAAAAPAGGGSCSARIVTEPAEVKVFWGEDLIGTSPIENARIPCGAGTLTFRRDRYQSETRDVTAAPGAPTVVSQRLHRPSALLVVGSSPPHAEVSLNGVAQGATPKRISASRFETVTVQVSLAGYQPWSKRVYLREGETRIGMQLVPTGGSAKRK